MIILDTNVISEALNSPCDPKVTDWLNRKPDALLFTTAITMIELLTGARLIPAGRRRSELEQAIEHMVMPLFESRCLAFDVTAARAYAAIFSSMRQRGRAIGFPDCQIAAIATVHGFAVATRDVQPFIDAGLDVINPWTDD